MLMGVTRKLAILVAAILVPGGLIALAGALFFKALSQTERGRKVVALAQKRLPAWAQPFTMPVFESRQAA
jgi:hypothetical protein